MVREGESGRVAYGPLRHTPRTLLCKSRGGMYREGVNANGEEGKTLQARVNGLIVVFMVGFLVDGTRESRGLYGGGSIIRAGR